MKLRIAVASSLLLYSGLTMVNYEEEKPQEKSVIFQKEMLPKREKDIREYSSRERLEILNKKADELVKKREEEKLRKWAESVKKEQERRREEMAIFVAEEKEKRRKEAERKRQLELQRQQEQQAKKQQIEKRTAPQNTKVLTVTATSYTYSKYDEYVSPKWKDKTFTGVDVHYGVVAVDPNVIPLGTKMKIEGFGDKIFTALDTGNAIVGHKIDVFLPNLEQAIDFGKKTLKIYIL